MPFKSIGSGQLGDRLNFAVGLPKVPKNGVGILFYIVDTREGDRLYRVDVNGQPFSRIALPVGNCFMTLHTQVGQLGQANNISFESEGQPGPPVDILNVVLFFE
jgi:hypothetical protein